MSTTDEQVFEIARELTQASAWAADTTRESPAVAEVVGQSLATALRPFAPDTVVLWSEPRTAVLGHIVARELGAKVIYAYSDEGILSLSAALGARIALVDYEWDPYPGLVPLLRMVQGRSTVVVVSSVLPLPPTLTDGTLAGAPTATLADLSTAARGASRGDTPCRGER